MSALQEQQDTEVSSSGNEVTENMDPENIKEENVSHMTKQQAGASDVKKSMSLEKLDELYSLEREIAKMHSIDESSSPTKSSLDGDDQIEAESSAKKEDATEDLESVLTREVDGKSSAASDEHELDNADLIAVLKGIDPGAESTDLEQKIKIENSSVSTLSEAEVTERVTIEGEGQFQIMEIDDDESDDVNMKMGVDDSHAPAASTSSPSSKTYGSTSSKLTREEERAVAMEQMAGLSAHLERRRRKQDIKSQQSENADLITALGADWSDDEGPVGQEKSKDIAKVPKVVAVTNTENASTLLNTDHVETAKVAAAGSNADHQCRKSSPLVTNVVVLQAGAPQSKSAIGSESGKQPENVKESEPTLSTILPPQATGFRRTRVIKRKIIWDPDAPETQVSYAQLVRSSGKSKAIGAPTVPVALGANSAISTTAKKEPAAKKVLKEKVAQTDVGERKVVRSVTPSKASASKTTATKAAVVEDTPRSKRRSQTPIANGANGSGGKKKKVSEIDRLMGDEGAVNMLNSLESERSKDEAPDKPHKHLMRARSAAAEKATRRSTTPTAVKKDIAAASRKRGPKTKASSSWDYVYKQQASDDAMIARRRSNSSYSSNASQHRLSLDGPISQKALAKLSKNAAGSNADDSSSSAKTGPKVSAKTAATSEEPTDNAGPTKSLVGNKAFEFAKPESKTTHKSGPRQSRELSSNSTDQLTSDLKMANAPVKRTVRCPTKPGEKDKSEKSTKHIVTAKEDMEDKPAQIAQDIIVKKIGKVAQIILNTNKTKISHTFSTALLNKLSTILERIGADVNINVAVMVSNGSHFCRGVDFSELLVGSLEKRNKAAEQLATATKRYLQTLATFPKPLIAGVNGHNLGLGVTQLILFDFVVAGDKSVFETPYVKIGQLPEGYSIWVASSKIRSVFHSRLFFLCEKLQATESVLSGLVSKLVQPSKVNDDALIMAKRIATMSAQSYKSMKEIRMRYLNAVDENLDKEFNTIADQWKSAECLDKFIKYREEGVF